MSSILSLLSQQLAEAQEAGDYPRQIALASAMLKERVSDADRLYVIVANACRELVIANDPSDVSAVLGWYQTWYRHTRDPAVRTCIDATQERVKFVTKAEHALNNAVASRDVVALRSALDALSAMTDRLSTTNLLIEQGQSILEEQLESNKRALTDRIRRSTVLRDKVINYNPQEIDVANEALATLLHIDPTAADDPEITQIRERLAQVQHLHEQLLQAIEQPSIAILDNAIADLQSHGEAMSTTPALLQQANNVLEKRQQQRTTLADELAATDRNRPDLRVPILEELVSVTGEDEFQKQLDKQQNLWADIKACHAIIAAGESSLTEKLAEAVATLRTSSGQLADSKTVLARGEKILASRKKIRIRQWAIRIGIGSAAALVIIGFSIVFLRDKSAYEAIRTTTDPVHGLELVAAYEQGGHFFYHDEVGIARYRLNQAVTENLLTALSENKNLLERFAQLEVLLAKPDLKQRSSFIDLRDQTTLEIDDQDFARANAIPDRVERMAALQAYADRTSDTARAEQAKRTITKIIRARDAEAWEAVRSAQDPDNKLAAITAYLALPNPAKQTEAIAAQNEILSKQAQMAEKAADDARWEKVLTIQDPVAGIVAIDDYLMQPGRHAAAAAARAKILRKQIDDQAWARASADIPPSQQIMNVRAYLERPGDRAHDTEAQELLATATWQAAIQTEDLSARLQAIQVYLNDSANQAYRSEAEKALKEIKNTIEDNEWQTVLAIEDIEERARMLEKIILSKTVTRHQQDAIETLTVMAREIIVDKPEMVVRFPKTVLSRLPITTLSNLSPALMRELPLSIEMKIPLTPPWSSSAGVDAYGRWSMLTVGQHTIRFRYIPEGQLALVNGKSITVKEPFWIAEAEINQALWVNIMGGFFSDGNPSAHRGDDLPIHNISRQVCDKFLKAVNDQLQKDNQAARLRLPTIAEWQYVASSANEGIEAIVRGQAIKFTSRDLVQLTYAAESGSTPSVVGSGRRDAWGLADILGNVGEWVEGPSSDQAWWSGGSWLMPRAACLPEALTKVGRDVVQEGVGVRVIIEKAGPKELAKP